MCAESRLAFCREKLGIADTINAGDGTAAERVKELTNGDNATVVIDATGNSKSMCGALRCLAHGGRLVYRGAVPGGVLVERPGIS